MKIKKYLLILSAVCMTAAWFLCSCDSAVSTQEKVINVKRAIELAKPANLEYTADFTQAEIFGYMVENADKYEIYMSESEVFGEEATATVYGGSYIAENLTAGKTYYFKVRATASHNNNIKDVTYYSEFSDVLKVTAKGYPVKPVVTAEIAGVDSVKLSWEEINDCYSYKVYQGEDSDSDHAKCISLYQTSCTYTAKDLILGKTYYFWVESSVGLEHYMSDAVAVEMKLPAPANFTAARKTSSSVELAWDVVAAADSYKVSYYPDDRTDDITQIDVTENKTTVTDLKTGVYIFKVSANKGEIAGAETDGVEVSTYLPAVTIKSVTPAGCVKSSAYSSYYDVTFEVEWEKLGMDEAGYAVYYSSSETYFSSADKIYAGKDVTSAKVTVKEMNKNTIYYFKVAAYDSNNKEGACSEVKSMKFQLATAPENFFGEMESDTSIKLSWDAVEAADCYNVYDSANKLLATVKDTDFVVTGLQYMTEYTLKVETKNIYGIISEKAETKAVTFPSVQNVKVKAVKEYNSINATVTWDNLTEDDVTYTVNFKELMNYSDGDKYLITDSTSDVTSGCIAKFTPSRSETSYQIEVVANKSGISSYSAPINVVFPDEVTNIKGESTDTTVKLSWTAADGATAYNIYKGTSSSGTKTLVTEITDMSKTEYTVESLLSGTVYYFWVEAVNADGNSAMSSYEEVKTLLSAPANVTVAATANYGELKVTYNSVSGATYYYIYVNTENVIPKEETKKVYDDTSYTLTELESGVEYYVWVRAYSLTSGYGAYSEAVTATPKTFGTPANVTVSATSNPGELSISFDEVAEASNYYVYVSTTDSTPATYTTYLTTNSGTITGLELDTQYYVWVRAYSSTSGVYGRYSEAVTATTKGFAAPANVKVAATDNPGELSISFDEVEGADRYYVYANTTDSKPVTSEISLTTNSGTITGLELNTQYYVWVCAYNSVSSVYSKYSEVATATTAGLSKPKNVKVTTNTTYATYLDVSWDAVDGTKYYYIYVNTENVMPDTYKTLTSETSRSVYGLEYDTFYYVWVKASDDALGTNVSYSDVATGHTGKYAAPTDVTVVATSNLGELKVSFTGITDYLTEISGYNIYVSESYTMPTEPTATCSQYSTSCSVTGLENNTEYNVWVRAYNEDDNILGDVSAIAVGTTRIFTAPSFTAATPGWNITENSGEIDLESITYDSTNTDYLYIYVSKTDDFDTAQLITYPTTGRISPASSYTIQHEAGLDAGALYYVWLVAYNEDADSYSEVSDSVSVTTKE